MTASLYLFPTQHDTAADNSTLIATLSEAGLIGSLLGAGRFMVGKDFLRLISLAGCSPYLEFEPATDRDKDFCHVRLLGPYPDMRLFTTSNRSKPRCPGCRQRISDWQDQVDSWRVNPSLIWTCPACHQVTRVSELDWRQYAATGRSLIEIRQIFPGEAIPSDKLLAELQQRTDMTWQYAWADSSID